MVFWLSTAVVVAVSLFFLLRSLNAAAAGTDARGHDIAFYRSQQDEIARQLKAGVIDETEAQAAETEAGRRLMQRAKEAGDDAVGDVKRARLAQIVVALAVPLVALPLYLALGKPNAPAQPFAERTDINASERELSRLIERLDAHLLEAPDDVRGNELAFPVYMRLSRFADAVVVSERLLKLKGESAAGLTAFAEARVFADGGVVADDVRKALQRALELDPQYSRAIFYSGLAVEQGGQPQKALAMWKDLATRLPDGAEKRAVTAQIQRLSAAEGPQGEAADTIRQMPDGERNAAIKSMVDGLETRLKTSGGTADEWLKLVRALTVMNEKQRAAQAFKDARQQLAADASAIAALDALGRELSLGEGSAQ